MSHAADQPPRIVGERMWLQPFTKADVTPAYLSWLNDPIVTRYSNQRFVCHTRESSLAYLDSFASSSNLFLSVRRMSDGLALGTMTAYVAAHHGTADMGILIGERTVWGQGYGLAAWSTLLHWLLHERRVRKVTAGALDCNAPMLRLMEKSGMRPEGARRRQEIVEGAEHDILYFARFRDD